LDYIDHACGSEHEPIHALSNNVDTWWKISYMFAVTEL